MVPLYYMYYNNNRTKWYTIGLNRPKWYTIDLNGTFLCWYQKAVLVPE